MDLSQDLHRLENWLRDGNVPQICRALKRHFPADDKVGRIRDLVLFYLDRAAPPTPQGSIEAAFLDCMQETKKLLRGDFSATRRHMSIGADLDFLSDRLGIGGWTLAQCMNYLLLRQIAPRRRSVVVTAMRDDGIYILEWIAHYRALGFDGLIVYTNDNADGSEELLRLLAAHGVITLIESEITGKTEPDGKAFGHAIHLLHELRDYEWALFVDSDEYFVPARRYRNSVARVLSALTRKFPSGTASGICYNWLWFISEMVFERAPGLLIERFQHAEPHILTKCMARIQDLVSMRYDHSPEVMPGRIVVDSVFTPVDVDKLDVTPPQYDGGRINHYWARSFEEFSVKKARGSSLDLPVNLYDRPFSQFFAWNGFETPENHFPPDPAFLLKVKREIERLSALEGVAEASVRIDENFPAFVKRVAGGRDLRKIYEASRVEPTAL